MKTIVRYSLQFALVSIVSASAIPAIGQGSTVKQRATVIAPLQSDFNKAGDTRIVTPFRNPAVLGALSGTNLFELRLDQKTFPYPFVSEVDPELPAKFQLLCYNQDRVGPTIRIHRGEEFRIRLVNQLQDPPDTDPGPVVGVPEGEKPHGLSTTNLHTHGLHVSPDGASDNIFRSIAPGKEFTFKYHLGKDHPSGTFWYHPHKHGSVAYQLSNGLAGALIVEGDPSNATDLESIPEIAAASEHNASDPQHNHERIVVMALYTYRKGDDGVGRIDATEIYNVDSQNDPASSGSISVTGPQNPAPVQVTAINGEINPTFTIAPGEVQRWRIIHAGWDILRRLVWVGDDNAVAANVQFNEIAVDGLATATMHVQSPLQIAPGQRSDVLIQGPALNAGQKQATYHLAAC